MSDKPTIGRCPAAGLPFRKRASSTGSPECSRSKAPKPCVARWWRSGTPRIRRRSGTGSGRLPFDDLVLFTGEGLRRLHGFAQRFGLEAEFLQALGAARKITRGPKPERALRELGLKSDLRAEEPTTDGLIETLSAHDLRGRRVGVQLYPGQPQPQIYRLLERGRGRARPCRALCLRLGGR